MAGFRVCDCNFHKQHIITTSEPSLLETLFDDRVRHPSRGSVFVFNGSKWTCCDQCDLDLPHVTIPSLLFPSLTISGPTGPGGLIGPVGPQGLRGSMGKQGDLGDQGIQGGPGDQGLQGPMGTPGTIGPPGPPGQSFPPLMGALPVPGPTGPRGLPGDITGLINGTEADRNTSIGIGAGTGSVMNTFFGYNAGNSETSSENTYIGHLAGEHSVSTGKNVFIGNEAGRYSIGAQNTYVGDGVCSAKRSGGSYNTFVGAEAGLCNTIGFGNTFLGTVSGASTTEGNWNIFIGQSAGHSNVRGTNNIFVGTNSGSTNVSGNSCICIGDGSDTNSNVSVNQIVIGQGVTGKADNTITFPSNLTAFSSGTEINFSTANGGCLYPVSSSRRWKTNIHDISEDLNTANLYNLRPVTFIPTEGHGNTDEMDIGFIAEEMNEQFPNMVPKDNMGEPASVKYSLLSVLTIEEMKKLKERLDRVAV